MLHRLLFLTSFLFVLQVEARPPRLNEFLVYSLEGIQAHSSDYQGRTGSGGPIELVNFNINLSLPAQENNLWDVPWALLSGQDIDFYRGSVTADKYSMGDANQYTNLLSPTSRLRQVGYNKWDKQNRLEPENLRAEMQRYKSFLDQTFPNYVKTQNLTQPNFVGAGGLAVNFYRISAATLSQASVLSFKGNDRELFVIQVDGLEPIQWVNTHIALDGVGAGQILFYFPDTTEITIQRSGSEMHTGLGLPFSIFAPKARITFNQALITGQVWVRKIESNGFDEAKRSPDYASPVPSGQINYSCFPWVRLGMKCNCS